MIKHLTFLVSLLAVLCTSCDTQTNTPVELPHVIVDIKNANFDTLLVQELGSTGWNTKDTLIKKDGLFHYQPAMGQGDLVKFTNLSQTYKLRVFTSPNEIQVNDSIQNRAPIVMGSSFHDGYLMVQDSTRVFETTMDEALAEYRSLPNFSDTVLIESIVARYNEADSLRVDWINNWIAENTNSPVAQYLYIVENMGDATLEEVSTQQQLFDSTLTGNSLDQHIAHRIAVLQKTAIGATAPVFTLSDTSGMNIPSSDVYGKYTLIDFWASWCGPCREENPNVVAAYNTYNAKGFTILGVSLDRTSEKWKQAILEDQLTWTHVSDLKGWKSEAGALYGVNAIPFNVLVDSNGVIVGKNLRGEELHQQLAELLD